MRTLQGMVRVCAITALGAFVLPASGQITQVFTPGDLINGPFTVEDFEDDTFEPGVVYSSNSGVRRADAAGFTGGDTPSGTWGLSTNSFPDPITLTFDVEATAVGMWFGNDDTCCSDGFDANLDIYDANGLLDTISVTANMNDSADQFLGFNSTVGVTRVTMRFGTGTDVGLFHYIDDAYFNVIPEPTTALLMSVAGGLLVARRRR